GPRPPYAPGRPHAGATATCTSQPGPARRQPVFPASGRPPTPPAPPSARPRPVRRRPAPRPPPAPSPPAAASSRSRRHHRPHTGHHRGVDMHILVLPAARIRAVDGGGERTRSGALGHLAPDAAVLVTGLPPARPRPARIHLDTFAAQVRAVGLPRTGGKIKH